MMKNGTNTLKIKIKAGKRNTLIKKRDFQMKFLFSPWTYRPLKYAPH